MSISSLISVDQYINQAVVNMYKCAHFSCSSLCLVMNNNMMHSSFWKIIYCSIIHIYIQCVDKNLCTHTHTHTHIHIHTHTHTHTLNAALNLKHWQVRLSLLEAVLVNLFFSKHKTLLGVAARSTSTSPFCYRQKAKTTTKPGIDTLFTERYDIVF